MLSGVSCAIFIFYCVTVRILSPSGHTKMAGRLEWVLVVNADTHVQYFILIHEFVLIRGNGVLQMRMWVRLMREKGRERVLGLVRDIRGEILVFLQLKNGFLIIFFFSLFLEEFYNKIILC